MRTNTLFTGEAPTGDFAAVTQLKIAARGKDDTRATREQEDLPPAAHTESAAVIDDEVRRSHGEWHRTLDAVRQTLATLERTCESAIETQEAGILGLVKTLAGSAREEALAAAQHTRAQAEAEMEKLRGALERHEIDLQEAREALKHANDQLETERSARSRAESERDAVQLTIEHITSQLQTARAETRAQKAELSLVRQQLEAETAERTRLVSVVQSVHALSLAHSENTAIAPPTPVENRPPEQAAHCASDAVSAAKDLEPPPVGDPLLVVEPFPEVVEDAKRLLDQAEEMYRTDLDSGCRPLEVVDRLTANLRYARDLIVRRWGSDECDAAAVLDKEIAALLDAEGGTSLGRHLSIAAFAARSSQPSAAS